LGSSLIYEGGSGGFKFFYQGFLTWAGQGFLTKNFSATALLGQRKNELNRKKGEKAAGDTQNSASRS